MHNQKSIISDKLSENLGSVFGVTDGMSLQQKQKQFVCRQQEDGCLTRGGCTHNNI